MRTETFDGSGNLIAVADDRSLTAIKEAKKSLVNDQREVVLNRGVWLYGYPWDTAERGRANVSGMTAGLAAGVPLPANFVWRSNNNINVPMTAPMFVNLGAQVLNYVNQVYGASWYIKTQIDGLSTLEEVDAFEYKKHPAWPTGNMDGSMPMSITPTSLANATANAVYSVTFTVSGGLEPFSYNIADGALPDGLALANNVLSGTPTVDGTYEFTLAVTDSMTPNAVVKTQTYTLNVNQ